MTSSYWSHSAVSTQAYPYQTSYLHITKLTLHEGNGLLVHSLVLVLLLLEGRFGGGGKPLHLTLFQFVAFHLYVGLQLIAASLTNHGSRRRRVGMSLPSVLDSS